MGGLVLVTGGAGFIGSNIVAALADRGDEVVVCDHLGTGEKWRNLARHLVADIIAPSALAGWLDHAGGIVRAVVHMGAVSSTTEADVDLILRSNFTTSRLLWDWCTAERVPLVYASSAATYGDGSAGFDDDMRPEALAGLRPLNAYGWSKHLFDRWVADQIRRGRDAPPHWAGLKFFNVYGPNEYHKGPMMSVVAKNHAIVAAGGTVQLFRSHRPDYADGGQLRDFVHVRDCVDVVLWLLDQRPASGLYNVGSGTARSFKDLIQAIHGSLFGVLGPDLSIDYIDMPATLRDRYQYFTRARLDRLRAAGYTRPMTGLEDGVADYVRNHLSRPDPYR